MSSDGYFCSVFRNHGKVYATRLVEHCDWNEHYEKFRYNASASLGFLTSFFAGQRLKRRIGTPLTPLTPCGSKLTKVAGVRRQKEGLAVLSLSFRVFKPSRSRREAVVSRREVVVETSFSRREAVVKPS